MRKNMYESAVVINAALEDDQIEAVIKKITDFIENNGGKITEMDKWGRKRLAYMIEKNRVGFYVIYKFEAPVAMIKELERLYRLDESVIRFLTIKLTKKALEYYQEQKEKAAEEEAESSEESTAGKDKGGETQTTTDSAEGNDNKSKQD